MQALVRFAANGFTDKHTPSARVRLPTANEISEGGSPMLFERRSRTGLTAAETVLAMWELLELILLYLPMRDILSLQRVSRSWRQVVTRSRPLQRALFLLPAERIEDACIDAKIRSTMTSISPLVFRTWVFNPLLINVSRLSHHPRFTINFPKNMDALHSICRKMLLVQPQPSAASDGSIQLMILLPSGRRHFMGLDAPDLVPGDTVESMYAKIWDAIEQRGCLNADRIVTLEHVHWTMQFTNTSDII